MQVTNGSVTFGRTVKPADYEGKKVEVTLAFAVAEGEDYEGVVAQVSVVAHDRAMVMLMMPDKAVGAIPMSAPAEPSTAAQPTGNVREPTTRRRRNLSEVVIGEKHNDPADIGGASNSTGTPAVSPTASSPVSGGDPADIGAGPTPAATVVSGPSAVATTSTTPTAAQADPASVDDWETPKAEVPTQEQLTVACQEANGRLGNPVPIRALVADFVGPPPKGVKDIPEAKRADFLAKLRALQPVAKAA